MGITLPYSNIPARTCLVILSFCKPTKNKTASEGGFVGDCHGPAGLAVTGVVMASEPYTVMASAAKPSLKNLRLSQAQASLVFG